MGEGLHSQGGCFAQAEAVSFFVSNLCGLDVALAMNSSKVSSRRWRWTTESTLLALIFAQGVSDVRM